MRLVFIFALMVGATSAHAGNADWHATANGSVATTDNETGAETGSPNRKGSFFTDVRPGMLFTYNSLQMIHELVTDVDLLYHFGRDKPNVNFHADWKAFFLPSPRTEITMGASALTGQLYSLSASSLPTETSTLVVPLGRVNTQQASGSEEGSYYATEGLRIWQRGYSRFTTTDDTTSMVSTKSFVGGAGLGGTYRLRADSFSLEGGGAYVYMEKLDPMMVQMGSRLDRQINPRGIAIWQHDFNREWSTNVDAGLVWVNPIGIDPYNPTEERKAAPFPVFGIIGAYTDVWGRAQLQARREVTPNLFIAQNTLTDSAVMTMAMPLHIFDKNSPKREPKVVGMGMMGVDRTQLIDPVSGSLKGKFNVARVDLGVGWQPRPGQTVGLRYEFAYQRGDTVAEMIVPTFFRNTFYFTFALRYPEDVQVRVPRRGQSVRADRNDLAPIGAEPVVNDPAEELLEDDDRGRR